MSTTGKIRNLYCDKEKTEALFPRTKTSAISDDNGIGLDAIIENMVHVGNVVEDTVTAPVDADTLGGLPASNYASQAFVTNKIAEAQLGGGEGGDIDLSGYATKDDIANIDYPVDSVNGKTGAVQLSASDVGARASTWTPTASDVGAVPTSITVNGKALSSNITLSASDVGARPNTWTPSAADVKALSISGGKITGELYVGDNLLLHSNDDGGNIVVYPPSDNTHTIYWEVDSQEGNILQFCAHKKATNANGGGYVYPLKICTDGSIEVENAEKTRANLGAAPAGYGLGDGGVYPTDLGLTTDTLARGGFYRWDTYAGGPFNYATMIVSPRSKDASAAQLAFCHAGTNVGVMASRMYSTTAENPWEYINPPMVLGTEYRTTERYCGKPVYAMAFNCGSMPNAQTLRTGLPSAVKGNDIVDMVVRIKASGASMQLAYGTDPGYFIEGHNIVFTTTGNFSAYTICAIVKYTKD